MVVTRIAPSPTGDPHVGTAYQALFDYIWAKKNGGTFIVRIEDTDQSRYNAESEKRILEMFRWLGIPYDEAPDIGGPHAPYRQSERLENYAKYAETLLEKGLAYHAFETPEELQEIRENLKPETSPGLRWPFQKHSSGRGPKKGGCRRASCDPPEKPQRGQHPAQRPVAGHHQLRQCRWEDAVLIKSDGFPTYHLAVVVDDHLMGVTDVIRRD